MKKDYDAAEAAYLSLLDRVLEDRHVDEDEGDALVDAAEHWGVSKGAVERFHQNYIARLISAALVDSVVTETEHRDLCRVAQLLGINRGSLDAMLDSAAQNLESIPPSELTGSGSQNLLEFVGKTVCFTGEFHSRHKGDLITRSVAEELAVEKGLVVVSGVTKKLDVLVLADPQTQSGKAKKARQYGVRIIHEPVFWKALDIEVT